MTLAEVGAVESALADAERDVLAVVLYSGTALPDVARGLRVEDFSNPRFRVVWEAVLRLDSRGEAIDAGTVAIELSRRDDPAVRIDRGDLIALAGETAVAGALPSYVKHVREASQRRQLRTVRTMLAQAESVGDPERSIDHARRAAALLATVMQPAGRAGLTTTDLDAFLNEADIDVPQVIPGIVERGERALVTGLEGGGKSTLLRQIAVQVASGIHPFTLDPIEPLPVLLLDLENPRRHLRRELRKLRLAAGADYRSGLLVVESRPQGLDLLDTTDRAWFASLVATVRPALIVVGPLYKLASGDPTEEKTARTVSQVLDDARVAVDAALLLEAHTPHASNGGKRPIRPYGASLWLRWPEFGINLGDDGALRHWRGARDERDWPAALKRGGEWPWTVDTRTAAEVAAGELTTDEQTCLRTITDAGTELATTDVAAMASIDRARVSTACNALVRRRPPLLTKRENGPGKPVFYSLPEEV